jgi:WD40 repeat protein
MVLMTMTFVCGIRPRAREAEPIFAGSHLFGKANVQQLRFSAASGQTTETNHWDLGLTTSDADISPDDQFLAVTVTPPRSRSRGEIEESIELWDYRQHEATLKTRFLVEGTDCSGRKSPIRFTSDGRLLVVAVGCKVQILEAATLKSIRTIEPALAPGFGISALETSPVSHVAIVAAASGGIYGLVLAYDLDTGRLLFRWKPTSEVRSISWRPDGTQFAIASPFPCTSIGNDVNIFSAGTWAHVQTLSAKNVQSLAFSDNRLYAVQTSFCKGSVFNRHLGLEAFDIHGWKRSKTIFLPRGDIHDSVSFANGRLMANTGAVSTEYDWSDGVTLVRNANLQFTVWKGDLQSVWFTSPLEVISPHGVDGRTRLSRTGEMVLFDPQHPQVFKIP